MKAAASATVIVPSVAMQRLITSWGVPVDRISVVPHGIDVNEIQRDARNELPETADVWGRASTRLLFVGMSADHKNILLLPEVLRLLRDSALDARLAMTIDPTERTPLTQRLVGRAAQSRVLDRITFLGSLPRADLHALYGRAHCVIYPSRVESFGFPILEAFALGVPVAASDIPSSRELAGGLAHYFCPDSPREAAVAVGEALAHRERLATARRQAVRRLTWDRHSSDVASLIRAAVGGTRERIHG